MFGFLANLGSGLARIGSGFAHGAASAGKGIGRGFKRLGESGEDEMAPESPSPYLTPAFNPAGGVRGLEDAVAEAENDARANLPMPDLPLGRRDLPIPAPAPAPSLANLRSALPSLPSRPSPPLVAAGAPAQPAPDLVPDMDLDRRNLPIPALPGHSGGPTAFNPIDAAKYDYVMSHAKRDAEGDLTGGFNRDWKTSIKNALLGASRGMATTGDLGGAIGGALTAGAGSAINPQAGYEFAFDVGERPKMEAALSREQAERAKALEDALNRAKLAGMEAETGLKGAQTDKTRADMVIARQAEDRERLVADSQRRLNEAKIISELTGVEKVEDIYNPQTGAFERVAIFPGGKTQILGRSAPAEIDLRKMKSQENIAGRHEAGEYGRESMRRASAKEIKQMDIDAERKMAEDFGGSGLKKPSSGQSAQNGQAGGATPEQIQRIISEAKKLGRTVTEEEVRARLKSRGQ